MVDSNTILVSDVHKSIHVKTTENILKMFYNGIKLQNQQKKIWEIPKYLEISTFLNNPWAKEVIWKIRNYLELNENKNTT